LFARAMSSLHSADQSRSQTETSREAVQKQIQHDMALLQLSNR